MSYNEVPLKELLGGKGYIRGPFGSALKRNELKEEGIPVYEQQHAIRGDREFRYYIDEEKYEKLKRFTVVTNDLIISCSGTVGRISVIRGDDPKGIISQALLILRPDADKILPEYLFYFFTSKQGFNELINASQGAVQLNIAPRAVVEKIPVPLPSINEQKIIINKLKTLDDKIELNRQTNQTLEQIAQAIFKSWFIDFEPVKAKAQVRASVAEGRTPGTTAGMQEVERSGEPEPSDQNTPLPADFDVEAAVERAAMCAISGKSLDELDVQGCTNTAGAGSAGAVEQLSPETQQQLKTTADLFPDALVESELGKIPEGWGINTIDDVTSLIIDHRGKTPKKLGGDWVEDGYPAVSAKNIKGGRIINHQSIRFLDKEMYSKWMKDELKIGDILLTSEAPMGEMYFLTDNSKFCLSQRLYALRADDVRSTPSYLYLWLQTAVARADLEGRATGTTVVGIRQSELRKVNVLCPKQEIVKKFEETVFPMFRQLYEKERENLSLSDIRDSLLPKLLSGSLSEVA